MVISPDEILKALMDEKQRFQWDLNLKTVVYDD
jgi:hypothetical protein